MRARNWISSNVARWVKLQRHTAHTELDQASGQVEAMKAAANKEAVKEQTLARAGKVIQQQLAIHQQKLNGSITKVTKYQRAGGIFGKVRGLPKRVSHEKRSSPFIRWVPGLTFQIQKTNHWFVDLNPSVRYRITNGLSTGIGWNERFVFDNAMTFYDHARVYGPRSFIELNVLKGLSLRADAERISVFMPRAQAQQDIGNRVPVWSYQAGIKKEFSIVQGVLGNVQFVYNLYTQRDVTLYFSKLNVRFGIDFPIKRQSSKEK